MPAPYAGAGKSGLDGIDSHTTAVSDASGKIGTGVRPVRLSGAQESIAKIDAAKDSIGTLAEGSQKVAGGAEGVKNAVDNVILPEVTAIDTAAENVSADSAIEEGRQAGIEEEAGSGRGRKGRH